jgi:hypothetical protein
MCCKRVGGRTVLAKLRRGDVDAPQGTVEVLAWLVPMIRERFPGQALFRCVWRPLELLTPCPVCIPLRC